MSRNREIKDKIAAEVGLQQMTVKDGISLSKLYEIKCRLEKICPNEMNKSGFKICIKGNLFVNDQMEIIIGDEVITTIPKMIDIANVGDALHNLDEFSIGCFVHDKIRIPVSELPKNYQLAVERVDNITGKINRQFAQNAGPQKKESDITPIELFRIIAENGYEFAPIQLQAGLTIDSEMNLCAGEDPILNIKSFVEKLQNPVFSSRDDVQKLVSLLQSIGIDIMQLPINCIESLTISPEIYKVACAIVKKGALQRVKKREGQC